MRKIDRALMQLGKEFKERRMDKGITLEQASRLAQISRSTVQRIEAGDGAVALNTLFAYAESIDLQDALVKAMVNTAKISKHKTRGLSEFERAKLTIDDMVIGK